MIRTEVVRENRVDARTGRYYERTRKVFVADDGRRFSNYSDAVRHEFQLEVRRGHFNDDGIRVTRVYTDDGEWIEEEELPELIDEDDKPEREVYVERFRRPNRQEREEAETDNYRKTLRRILEESEPKPEKKYKVIQVKKREGSKSFDFDLIDMPEIEEVKPYIEKKSKGRKIFVLKEEE